MNSVAQAFLHLPPVFNFLHKTSNSNRLGLEHLLVGGAPGAAWGEEGGGGEQRGSATLARGEPSGIAPMVSFKDLAPAEPETVDVTQAWAEAGEAVRIEFRAERPGDDFSYVQLRYRGREEIYSQLHADEQDWFHWMEALVEHQCAFVARVD